MKTLPPGPSVGTSTEVHWTGFQSLRKASCFTFSPADVHSLQCDFVLNSTLWCQQRYEPLETSLVPLSSHWTSSGSHSIYLHSIDVIDQMLLICCFLLLCVSISGSDWLFSCGISPKDLYSSHVFPHGPPSCARCLSSLTLSFLSIFDFFLEDHFLCHHRNELVWSQNMQKDVWFYGLAQFLRSAGFRLWSFYVRVCVCVC